MKEDLKWYILVQNNQLDLSPTQSKGDRIVEEFDSFMEANKAFKFYDNLLTTK
jgi:hypothetical protein